MGFTNKFQKLHRVPPHQGRADHLRLDMNENPEGLPQEFFDRVMSTITPAYIAMYPEPDKLTGLLADYLGVNKDQILITNGSDEALKMIFEVFGCAGKKMISVWPTFAMYMVNAQMMEMERVEIPYADDFTVDPAKVIEAIDEDTRIVSLLNPNNPIGSVYTEDEVKAVIEKARKVGALVIIDEAYHYFYNKTFLELCKSSDNVILVRTFSKLCSIAGLRIGYAVSAPEIIHNLFNAKTSFNVNTVALRFAEEIIQDQGLIDRLIAIEKEGREYVIGYLKEKNIPHYAQNGNYVFIYVGKNAKKMVEVLAENKVLVKYYEDNPMLCEYIRISTGSKKVMEQFIREFELAGEKI